MTEEPFLFQDVHEAWVMPKVIDITKKSKSQAPVSNKLIEELSRLKDLQLRTQKLQVLTGSSFGYGLFHLSYKVLIYVK